MSKEIEITVPSVGESISEVFIGEWYVDEGSYVPADGNLVGLETDKATFDVPAKIGGIVSRVLKAAGETAAVGETIGYLTEAPRPAKSASGTADSPEATQRVMPAAERLMEENDVVSGTVDGTGPGGRVLKEDVTRHINRSSSGTDSRETKTVKLSPIRRTIAGRLVSAQQTAALLTTFNEIDMSRVKQLRSSYREAFEKKYGFKLGFMSFFVKASVTALQEFPQVNARMNDDTMTYHNYCDIGIAIGGGKGLVVPILRNAENMSFADIERTITDLAVRAQKNQIALDELEGGTFTITNGGVYGSLLSTPIVNPPQSGVLGMHGIVDRPVAVEGEVVIRPMMYIALTYDHRLVDGREAVTFLKRIKELIEDPTRLVIEV
ncbi:MAG: 2-oxoglutarate dehydrogenase complex dihydrolipoyllysine-residue succinyltransferase [Planctomycetaceae bacterium]|jgi:2-oxoglutarate dehydrogenase E2 component (dihydrolipoamide succinyltransferase)